MDGTYPSSFNIKQVVKINGVYEGYKVNGHYNLTLDYTYTDESNYSILYDYDCTYTVSYNGKGMKVIATGKMTMALPDYTYDMNYAVYDNDNTLKYNYNYKSSP